MNWHIQLIEIFCYIFLTASIVGVYIIVKICVPNWLHMIMLATFSSFTQSKIFGCKKKMLGKKDCEHFTYCFKRKQYRDTSIVTTPCFQNLCFTVQQALASPNLESSILNMLWTWTSRWEHSSALFEVSRLWIPCQQMSTLKLTGVWKLIW